MQSPSPSRNDVLSLLEAICESDASAWCYIPRDSNDSAFCSGLFQRQWRLAPNPSETCAQDSVKLIANALDAMGIPTAELFARVSATVTDIPDNMTVLRADGVCADVRIQCIFNRNDGTILGHVMRFTILSDTHGIDSILEQIAVARAQLRILSKREREILNLVYEGRTNKSIAIAMKISEKTVEKHRARIVMKLGLNSTTMLIRLITVANLLPMPDQNEDHDSSDDQLTAATHRSHC